LAKRDIWGPKDEQLLIDSIFEELPILKLEEDGRVYVVGNGRDATCHDSVY
jgi:hypothetical protein